MILVLDMSSLEVLSPEPDASVNGAADPKSHAEPEGLRLVTLPVREPDDQRMAAILPADLLQVDLETFLDAMRSR